MGNKSCCKDNSITNSDFINRKNLNQLNGSKNSNVNLTKTIKKNTFRKNKVHSTIDMDLSHLYLKNSILIKKDEDLHKKISRSRGSKQLVIQLMKKTIIIKYFYLREV